MTSAARRRWLAMLVAVVAVLPYLNSLRNDFAFDDILLIRVHPMITGTESPWHLLTWVTETGGWYRPLTMLTYAANERLGDAPFGYHLVNLVLHVIVTLGVFWLAVLLLDSTFGAVVAGLLFAVHPIHTEAVTSIVGRAELLAAALIMGALFAFVAAERAQGRRRWLWMTLSVIAFEASCFAKESAFAAIPLFAATYMWLTPGWRRRRTLALLALYGATGGIYLAIRAPLMGALTRPALPGALDNPLAYVDVATRLRTAIIILWQYLCQLVVPIRLSADYSFNEIPLAMSFADPRFVLAAVAFTATAFVVAVAVRRTPVLVMAVLFLVVPLALTSNVLFPIGTIKAERLLYFPSIGWCLALAALATLGARAESRLWLPLLALLLTAFAARSWIRNHDWRDNATLFAATLFESPASAKAHHNIAATLQQHGRLNEAMAHYRRALEIYPEYAQAAAGIGNIYQLRGLDAGAMHWYLRALAIEPDYPTVHVNIATIRQQRGEYDAAEAALRTALQSAPGDPLVAVHLGAVLLAQGDRWRARNALRYSEALPPPAGDPDAAEEVRYTQRELEVAVQ